MSLEEQTKPNKPKKENPFISLLANIIIPTFIMMKGAKPEYLGPVNALLVGISFPVVYFIYDLWKRKKYNFISILGFVSILLTGGLGLLEVDGVWFAVKEAAVPLVIGGGVVLSMNTSTPLVKTFLLNDEVMNLELVETKLDEHNKSGDFEALLRNSSWLLAFSFLLSAVLNFFLALYILTSPAGTPEFTEELGKLQAVSFPVIALPCSAVMMIALWRLVKGLMEMTGLDLEQILHHSKK